MLLRCLRDHNHAQNEQAHFEPGKIYDVPDELGRRLLNDFGATNERGERTAASQRGELPKFEKVAAEADVDKAQADLDAVRQLQAGDAEVIKVNEHGIGTETGQSGTHDHTHLSQSEPPHQPPYAGEGETLKPAEEGHDHTSATEGSKGTPHGDTLSEDVTPSRRGGKKD